MNHPYPSQPIRVLHLRGDDRAIGRQHGEQVTEAASHGMATFYYEFWRRMSGQRPAGLFEGAAHRLATSFIDPVLVHRLMAKVPLFAQERIEGMSEALQRPYEQLSLALVLPDLFPMLQSLAAKFRPAMFVETNTPPLFGCSSFVYEGDQFLHGRNLDFPGVGYWDRYPVIQCVRRNGYIPYIGFASAGVPLAGITGVNEAQISVSLHQHYCRETSIQGSLPFLIAEELLGTCRTLDEALSFLRRHRVSTSWAFVVTDGKVRDGFIHECHPVASGTRFLKEHDGLLSHSNYFQSAECRAAEYATTCRMNWDNYWRKTRLENLVKAQGAALQPAQAASFISEHFDPYWGEEKPLNRTVSQAFNIQSLILDSHRMRVWMAAGDSPIHLRDFEEFDLGEIFAGREGRTGVLHPGYRFKDENLKKAKEKYILGFIAAFDGDQERSLGEVEDALASAFFAEGAQVAGVLNLKLGNLDKGLEWLSQGRASLEEKCRKKGLKLPPEYFETCLYQARAMDLLGKRREALQVYDYVAKHPDIEDTNVRALARKAGPYTQKKLSRVLMPFATYVPFE